MSTTERKRAEEDLAATISRSLGSEGDSENKKVHLARNSIHSAWLGCRGLSPIESSYPSSGVG